MPVRRNRRTLFLANEVTALLVAHVNSSRRNHRRGCNKLLGRIRPGARLGTCPAPHAPSLPPRTPQHGHAHLPAPIPVPHRSGTPTAGAADCRSAGTEIRRPRRGPGGARCPCRGGGALARRHCQAGHGGAGSIIHLLGLPRLLAVEMF